MKKNKSETQKENKRKLIEDVVFDLTENNLYENLDYIRDLLRESLNKRTQKELKQILYGE